MKAEWKCVWERSGVQCAMMAGTPMMLEWCVLNLDTPDTVSVTELDYI